MTDYLLTTYDADISASITKEEADIQSATQTFLSATQAATQIWNSTLETIRSRGVTERADAAMAFSMGAHLRNQVYLQGSVADPHANEQSKAQTGEPQEPRQDSPAPETPAQEPQTGQETAKTIGPIEWETRDPEQPQITGDM